MQVLVQWLDEASDPQNETVALDKIRPAPPHPPAGWVASLRVGEPCDVHYDGWGTYFMPRDEEAEEDDEDYDD